MVPVGDRQCEQFLQYPVHMGGGKQVRTTRHQCHTVGCIVERRSEVIAGGQVLTHEDDVSERARIGDHAAGFGVDPDQLAHFCHRPVDVEPKCRVPLSHSTRT